jgi:hypothetical protein
MSMIEKRLFCDRWSAGRGFVLLQSVDVFLAEAGKINPAPHVGLVTWAADYGMPLAPFAKYQKSKMTRRFPST